MTFDELKIRILKTIMHAIAVIIFGAVLSGIVGADIWHQFALCIAVVLYIIASIFELVADIRHK